MSNSNRVQIDISSISQKDYRGSKIDFERLLEEQLKDFSAAATRPSDDEAASMALDRKINGLLWEIRAQTRQETRLAMVLRVLLDEPEVGLIVLDRYKPIAQYEAQALRDVRQFTDILPSKDFEGAFAQLIPRQLRWSFSKNRGVALLNLAHHLGHHRLIRDSIENEITRSGSFEIQMLRDVIREELRASARRERAHAR